MLKLAFFWTPSLSASVLRDILATHDIEVAFVVTNPDKPFGRKRELTPSPVKALAIEKNIPVFTPAKIRGNTEFLAEIKQIPVDYFIVVAYGKILPKEILDMPHKACINVHGSILPKLRGASPIQSALIQWASETGISIMLMSEGMDEGDILAIKKIPIDPKETSGTLFEKFAEQSGNFLIETLRSFDQEMITPIPQKSDEATYCTKLTTDQGKLDFSQSAEKLYHRWQGFSPAPGVYTIFEGKRLLIESCSYQSDTTWEPGTAIKHEGNVAIICNPWLLILETVKPEGKKSMPIRDFVNGNQSFIGAKLNSL